MSKFLLILLLPFATLAAEESKVLELPAMPSDVNSRSNSKVSFSTSCSTATGTKLKQGDAGYDACLIDASTNMHNRNNSGKAGSNHPGGPDQNFELKFGE